MLPIVFGISTNFMGLGKGYVKPAGYLKVMRPDAPAECTPGCKTSLDIKSPA